MQNIDTPQTIVPITYSPSFEHAEKDNQQALQELLEVLKDIREKTFKDNGHALRSVHAKSFGLLKGRLEIVENLPHAYAQGLFSKSAEYDVMIRLSSSPGDILPDSISTPKGFAIKILNVPGERLAGYEKDTTQDFVLVGAGTTFPTSDLKAFAQSLKLLGSTTDKATGLKVAASTVLRGVESVIETFGGESGALKGLGGEPEYHILGKTFYTQVPFLYGTYMAKFSIVPESETLKALTDIKLHAGNNHDAIRDAVKTFFSTNEETVWELKAQLCTDIEEMPIEDATVQWPENLSPYTTIARIVVAKQDGWNAELAAMIDDGMSFSPWHCIAAHRPLGSINRARKPAYHQSAKFRLEKYGNKANEPANLE